MFSEPPHSQAAPLAVLAWLFCTSCSVFDRPDQLAATMFALQAPHKYQCELSYAAGFGSAERWCKIYAPILTGANTDEARRRQVVSDLMRWAKGTEGVSPKILKDLQDYLETPPKTISAEVASVVGSYLAAGVVGRGLMTLDLRNRPGSKALEVYDLKLDYEDYRKEDGEKVGRRFRVLKAASKTADGAGELMDVASLLDYEVVSLVPIAINHFFEVEPEAEHLLGPVRLAIVVESIQVSTVHGLVVTGRVEADDGVRIASFTANGVRE